MTRASLAALLALAALAVTAPAAAAELPALVPPAAADARPADARKRLAAGEQLLKKKDFAAAEVELRHAYALGGPPAALLGLATCLGELGRPVEALEALEKLVAAHGPKLRKADLAEATRRIGELASQVGTLELMVTPAGGTFALEGGPSGTLPLASPLRLAAGTHRVQLRKEGFLPAARDVSIAGGQALVLDVRLEEERRMARLAVRETTGAKVDVSVDGRQVGAAPWEGELPPGPHVVSVAGPATRCEPIPVELAAGRTFELAIAAIPRTGRVKLVVPAGASIAIDGTVAGTGTFEGELPEGEHRVEIVTAGLQPRAEPLVVVRGRTLVRDLSVAAPGPSVRAPLPPRPSSKRGGVYGALSFAGATRIAGVPEVDCAPDATCSDGTAAGGGLLLRLGGGGEHWAFGGAVLAMYDTQQSDQSVPGTATPGDPSAPASAYEHDERYAHHRLSGFGGLGPRYTTGGDVFRFTMTLDVGAVYRRISFRYEVTGEVEDGGGRDVFYVGPAALLGASLLIGGGTSFELGVVAMADLPPQEVVTESEPGHTAFADDQDRPFPIPPRTVASGLQLYVGPVIGVHFGD